MEGIQYLELKRLIKELEFVESQYVYQSEIIKRTEPIFKNSIETIVAKYPKLSEVWIPESKMDIHINPIGLDHPEIYPSSPTKSDVLKKLYREIVKITHPDKILNKKLNNLYIEATSFYEEGDIISIYRICDDLMIKFDWSESEIIKIMEKISDIKAKIKLLESTYTYKWLVSEKKDDVILDYIKNRIDY